MSPLWRNHTGNQSCNPSEIAHPASLQDLVELVRRAEADGRTVRAAGARHSWSDIALTEGVMVEPDGLAFVERADPASLTAAAQGRDLVWVGAGTHLHELNAKLDHMGLALSNMGGYDAQTIAGVISTSTHGSGLAFGPFPDAVRSLELVVAGGRALRLEPTDGPTDPRGFAAEGLELVKDDERFAAAICGLGTLGLLYAVQLEVREKFWLKEVRTLDTWERVRGELSPEGVLGEPGHYELFVNPYAGEDGEHRLLVTRRTDTSEPGHLPQDKLERHPLTELEASWHFTGVLLRFLARHFPRLVAGRFDDTLAGMCDDDYTNVSYNVFNIGEANKLPAYSMELGIAVDGRHVEAVDRILALAAERAGEGLWHTSPFSLRFVAPSRAYASMMYDQPTMMIELIMVAGSRGGIALLEGYEEALEDLGVRPHWGQVNALGPERPSQLYPKWSSWLAAEREYNASGVFDSPFTRRVGISQLAERS
ncbi:MAG TPA: FAD-binding protein [Solirubrobacterales bacterium]